MSWTAEENEWHLGADVDLCPRCSTAPATKVARIGFERPEPGSRERYEERRRARPWSAHTFWWIVHNAIAHPLIAFVPRRPMFRFHDWTSYKMHGVTPVIGVHVDDAGNWAS
ncbi:MAG: hypothetical protein ACKV2T_38395 [Kofleriaceae bacterium]